MVSALEELHLTGEAVVNPLKVAVRADGPGDGAGVDAQHLFQLLHQLEGIPAGPVQLVDEGEDGDGTHAADVEELDGLGLHALGCIDEHHGAVRGDQGAVGVLGKVLVAGGIQDVDMKAVELELHHRAGDGNAALLFDLHPVGGGSLGPLALDLTGLRDGAAVEQKLFRQSGLTGVRVRNDSECPPPGNFFF